MASPLYSVILKLDYCLSVIHYYSPAAKYITIKSNFADAKQTVNQCTALY